MGTEMEVTGTIQGPSPFRMKLLDNNLKQALNEKKVLEEKLAVLVKENDELKKSNETLELELHFLQLEHAEGKPNARVEGAKRK